MRSSLPLLFLTPLALAAPLQPRAKSIAIVNVDGGSAVGGSPVTPITIVSTQVVTRTPVTVTVDMDGPVSTVVVTVGHPSVVETSAAETGAQETSAQETSAQETIVESSLLVTATPTPSPTPTPTPSPSPSEESTLGAESSPSSAPTSVLLPSSAAAVSSIQNPESPLPSTATPTSVVLPSPTLEPSSATPTSIFTPIPTPEPSNATPTSLDTPTTASLSSSSVAQYDDGQWHTYYPGDPLPTPSTVHTALPVLPSEPPRFLNGTRPLLRRGA